MYQFSLEGLTPVKSDPYPFTPLQREWLVSLRSGKYKQGRGWLKDADCGYCCLGVLCELAGLVGKKTYDTSQAYTFDHTSTRLPKSIIKTTLLRSDIGDFTARVKFPNVGYAPVFDQSIRDHGHDSLAAMNDVLILNIGEEKYRAFNFKEIADYIEFDPWNIFASPEEAAALELGEVG